MRFGEEGKAAEFGNSEGRGGKLSACQSSHLFERNLNVPLIWGG